MWGQDDRVVARVGSGRSRARSRSRGVRTRMGSGRAHGVRTIAWGQDDRMGSGRSRGVRTSAWGQDERMGSGRARGVRVRTSAWGQDERGSARRPTPRAGSPRAASDAPRGSRPPSLRREVAATQLLAASDPDIWAPGPPPSSVPAARQEPRGAARRGRWPSDDQVVHAVASQVAAGWAPREAGAGRGVRAPRQM